MGHGYSGPSDMMVRILASGPMFNASRTSSRSAAHIPAPPEAVTVMLHEYEEANYMRGGETRTGAAALPDPAGVVHSYLAAMEERDLQKAESFLGTGFVMQFPGAAPMHRLQELVDEANAHHGGT